MKKIIILFLVIILSACKNVKQEDLYTLNINGNDITVGYDNLEAINDDIFEYSLTNIDDKEILDKIVVYVKDVDGNISIDGKSIGTSISETCTLFNGEYSSENRGHVCLLAKRVKKHDNYIIIYGDILDDDIDRIDRLEVYYK